MNTDRPMTDRTRTDGETLPLFLVDGTFYFKHYFDDELFGELSQFYNNEEYRFEVPRAAVDEVLDVLEAGGKQPARVDDPEEYVVVKQKYTNHPDVLFKRSVLQTDASGYNLFLMQDRSAVNAAITNGAAPLGETDLSFDP